MQKKCVRLNSLLGILVLCFVVATPAACAETVLTVHNWSPGTEAYGEIMKELAKAFEEKHPGVKVELISAGSGVEPMEKIPVMAAAGVAPDVFLTLHRAWNSFLRMGIIADITPYIQQEPSLLSALVPPLVEHVQQGGKVWGVPESWNVWLTHVNRDAFANAGLDQPDGLYQAGQWNFDALVSVGSRLTKYGSDDRLEQIGIITNGDHEVSYPWVWGYGEDVFSADGRQVFLNRPGVREGYQFFADLLNMHKVANIINTPGGVGWGGFTGGKWGLAFWWSDIMFYLNKEWKLPWTFDILPFPAGPVSDKTNLIGLINTWTINSASTKKDLAWEFIKFATSAEWDRVRIQRLNALPVHTRNVGFAVDHLGRQANATNLPLVLMAMNTQAKAYPTPLDLRISHELTKQLDSVWLGRRPLLEALEEGQRTITQMIMELK
jgi:ABC-type glycerol-3-phosphate transport system substrate-binding protein